MKKMNSNNAFFFCLLLCFFYTYKCQYTAILGLDFLIENCVIDILILFCVDFMWSVFFAYVMNFPNCSKKGEEKLDNVQRCFDPQYLMWQSKIYLWFLVSFICLVFILFNSLGQCLPALLNLLEAKHLRWDTSESTACFDTGAITENGICITLLSVKLSRWKRLYSHLGP